mgnify:CR=1 FL=1
MFIIMFGVLSITFIISRCLPSSPVELMLGSKPTAEQIISAKKELGLDRPLIEQYVIFIGKSFKGDFGKSLITKQPVIDDIFLRVLDENPQMMPDIFFKMFERGQFRK